MALAIAYVPPDLSSFQDDLIYTVTDTVAFPDPVTYPNFKFIGDVYIGGVLVARLKKIPHPTTGVGVFNIGQIVRSYAATAFNPTGSLLAQVLGEGEFFLNVVMKFGEEYSFTEFLDIEVDLQRAFFNNYNRTLFGAASSLIAKSNDMATNRSFMNNNGHVLLSSAYYLVPFFPTSTTAVPIIVTPIRANGSTDAPYTTSVTPSAAFEMQQINISPVAINAASPGKINSTTAVYSVQIGTINTIFIAIGCEAQYTPYMVHFLNQYGGFDSQQFTKVSRRTYNITRSTYGKLPYTVDEAGNVEFVNTNKVYNETGSTYSSQFTETLTLNSDLLNDADYVWLKDLMFSPLIYLEDSGYFYPVQIQENNYEAKKAINDQLTNLTITLKFGKTYNAQYR